MLQTLRKIGIYK